MTHEEMEKAMQFIIEQQGQFVVDIHQMKGSIQEMRDSIEEMKDSIQGLSVVVQQVTQVQAGFQKQLGQLTEATLTVVGLVGQLADRQARTDNKLVETDGRLNTLIDIVERYIRHRNGNSEN